MQVLQLTASNPGVLVCVFVRPGQEAAVAMHLRSKMYLLSGARVLLNVDIYVDGCVCPVLTSILMFGEVTCWSVYL